MKLLLTSGGVTNPTIEAALVELLGKPDRRRRRPLHPDRAVGSPDVRPGRRSGVRRRWTTVAAGRHGLEVGRPARAHGAADHRRRALGAVGPGRRRAARRRRRCDLPLPLDAGVRTGRPAAVTDGDGLGRGERRQHGDDAADRRRDFVEWAGAPDDRTLGVVDFSIFPHLDVFPDNTLDAAERWAEEIGGPAYVLDDQSAIQVVDGAVEVISEGQWKRLASRVPALAAGRWL